MLLYAIGSLVPYCVTVTDRICDWISACGLRSNCDCESHLIARPGYPLHQRVQLSAKDVLCQAHRRLAHIQPPCTLHWCPIAYHHRRHSEWLWSHNRCINIRRQILSQNFTRGRQVHGWKRQEKVEVIEGVRISRQSWATSDLCAILDSVLRNCIWHKTSGVNGKMETFDFVKQRIYFLFFHKSCCIYFCLQSSG